LSQLSITVGELRELLERGEPVTVLDVRSPADRAEWFIPGSTHVDVHDALWVGDDRTLDELALPAERLVVTVCGRGRTSLLAAERLRRRGLPARSLTGGMEAWSLAWNAAVVPVPKAEAQIVQVRRTGKGCLSYLVGGDGCAAVIDPSVEAEVYVDLARAHGWNITAVLDTHVHADHLSRARTLAERTGATLYLPRQDRVAFPFTPLDEGAQVAVGEGTLRALRTAADPTNLSILEFLSTRESAPMAELEQATKMGRLALTERVNDLAQVGLAGRNIDTDHVQSTSGGVALVGLVGSIGEATAKTLAEALRPVTR